MKQAFLLLILLAPPAAAAQTEAAQPNQNQTLDLDAVLRSTEQHYPPLLAALRDIETAHANLMTARGSFDTKLNLKAGIDRFGFYENERIDVGLEQALQWWGAKVYTGWRTGQGGFAAYDGLLETRDGGEFRAGIKLPLLRDRAIDESRADLQKGQLGVVIAERSVDEQRLLVRRLATSAYWKWLAAGLKLGVARSVLDLALTRDDLVRESVAAGALASVEILDNQRAILSRRATVLEEEQKLRQAAIYLSLFYRDGQGRPLVPTEAQLPAAFPGAQVFAPDRVAGDLEEALARRPELRRLRAETDQVRLDEQLANNLRLPSLDLSLAGMSESGTNKDVKRGPDGVKVGLAFKFPVQQRKARGKQLKTDAKLGQLAQKERFLMDKIGVEVREAALAVVLSYEKAELLRQEVALARELQALEKERYELGDSNLFTVNLREEAAEKAEKRRLSTMAEYYLALAMYQMVTAQP